MFIAFNKTCFLRKLHNIIQPMNSLLLLLYIFSFLKIKKPDIIYIKIC